ncbi:hypothetical protein B1759_06725 [Rubrivirga sp. SAORIC476]|nr:hypothetical protein B1759_06725 [Rubrivirga sp. SAORIC476]
MQSYEDLRVWQKGVVLCELVYGITRSFPGTERFELTSQLCRAAVSVPSTIAEGWGRGSKAEYARFLKIARGSLFELRPQLIIAERIGLCPPETVATSLRTVDQIRRMLHGLVRSLG